MKEWIGGRNPVYECLRAGRRHFFRMLLAEGTERSGRIKDILELAARRRLAVEWVDKHQLEQLAEGHQGAALQTSAYPYAQLANIFERAQDRGEALFMLLLDQVQDPQNVGTLLRSAEVFGVHGLLLPPNRSAAITPAVVHASSGASELLLIAQGNLSQAITAIQAHGAWVLGLDMDSHTQPLEKVDLSGPLALVVGSEGSGLRRLVRDKCDLLARILMRGQVTSLNAAVAGSIALYLASLQRS